jgi:hypothetical protein
MDVPDAGDATVQDVLDKIQDPFWRPLPFVGLVDRKGQAYMAPPNMKKSNNKKSKDKKKVGPFLNEACQNRPPRQTRKDPHRDVLVGILKNSTADKTYQLARPILGDDKVVSMLEDNGYVLTGWKQDRKREATLTETRAVSNIREQSWMSSPVIKVLILVFVAVVAVGGGKYGVSMVDDLPSIPDMSFIRKLQLPDLHMKQVTQILPLWKSFTNDNIVSKTIKKSSVKATETINETPQVETIPATSKDEEL